jgi:hypothetical protein
MNKETFNEIIDSLQRRVNLCYLHLAGIYDTEDLGTVSLSQAATLKQFCVEEETIMTKICMVDLYHIIGMGQLSPTQMMKFTYLMQDYLSYRPTIKVLAQKLDKIGELPSIPVKTRFKLLGLCDITLTYGEGEEVDEASVEDYTVKKKSASIPEPPEDLPFTVSGNVIEVDPERANYFIQLMEELFKVSLSTETFIKKVNAGAEYFGIAWKGPVYFSNYNTLETTKITLVGNIKNNNTKQKLTAYYSNRKKVENN